MIEQWENLDLVRHEAAQSGQMELAEKLAWKDVLRRRLPAKARLTILEIGTRTGALAMLMAELGHQVIGLEQSEGMLEVARQRSAENQLTHCHFIYGAWNAPQFPPAQFDLILANRVLRQLSQPRQAISAWSTLLKEQGTLLILEDDVDSMTALQQAKWFYKQIIWENRPTHLNSREIDELLEHHHFTQRDKWQLAGQLRRIGRWQWHDYAVGYTLNTATLTNTPS